MQHNALILGGARRSKSGCALSRTVKWLGLSGHKAWIVATTRAGDPKMSARIKKRQVDRASQLPTVETHEEPRELAGAIRPLAEPQHLLIVDGLTRWVKNLLTPLQGNALSETQWLETKSDFLDTLAHNTGSINLVSNEIGFGVMPMSAQARDTIDVMGRLHQKIPPFANTSP